MAGTVAHGVGKHRISSVRRAKTSVLLVESTECHITDGVKRKRSILLIEEPLSLEERKSVLLIEEPLPSPPADLAACW